MLVPNSRLQANEFRSKVQLSVGQEMLALTNTARYRNLSLADPNR